MKQFTCLLMLALFTSACVLPASTAQPYKGQNPFTPEAAAHICAIADLQTSSSAQENADGNITLGVTLINGAENICNLPPQPQISLLDGAQPLEIKLVQADSESASVNISPSGSVILIVLWQNYCGKAPKNDLTLRLTIQNGETLDVAFDSSATPTCQNADNPSTLTVNPYSYPP